jgi:tetratricopeptide (TPR) repeat protein
MRGKMGFVGALALAAAATALGQGDQWDALIKRGTAAEIAGDYAAAAAAYRDASRVAEAFKPEDARRVYAFNAQGMMYDAMGRFSDAEMSYRRALAALDLSKAPAAMNRAVLLANLANVCLEIGQDARAEKLLRESIDLHNSVAEPDEARISIARNTLAEFLTVKGRHDEAAPLIESSIAVLVKHPDYATELGSAFNNLGAVRLYQQRHAEALELLERSLATLEAARGASHPILLRTLHNLAIARQRNGQRDAAGVVWRRAFDLGAASLGLEHPLYGEILGNYAAYLRETGNKSQSKALAARSAEILRDHHRRNGVGGVVDITTLRQRFR